MKTQCSDRLRCFLLLLKKENILLKVLNLNSYDYPYLTRCLDFYLMLYVSINDLFYSVEKYILEIQDYRYWWKMHNLGEKKTRHSEIDHQHEEMNGSDKCLNGQQKYGPLHSKSRKYCSKKSVKMKYGLLWKHETKSVLKLHIFSAFQTKVMS